ncbi:acyl-CoA dehydrogenase family protein [Micromonospora sp. DSM 115977]|uniref:Acyl-CoA dehydrogenase family protein n=1 Tax=Micromonospora reichwaldensis TaxID=3075516 RepID=A0ABU2X3R4_9ACTN|nr:acyl-CoA dehydrogenase family protein [Micromonospora sp. DSM 115977]MDT0532830.1 acyl-CoA dehydrogenase family protein [Micromonospora sp. DSM 115977]
MFGELTATTAAGRELVSLAEGHVGTLVERAGRHDRDNTFVADNFADLRDSGVLAACAPTRHGGLGVRSLHDVLVAVSRLARGCGSTAICANMHMASVWGQVRRWERAEADGDQARAAQLDAILEALGGSDLIMAGASTEPGATWNGALTEAVRKGDEYVVTGRKTFVTNSAVADSFNVAVRVADPDGGWRHAEAVVLAGTPGLTVLGDWDALGMRGSGSHGLLLEDCVVPADRVTVGEPFGPPTPEDLARSCAINFPLLGASLGIAEAAFQIAVEHATRVPRQPGRAAPAHHPSVQREIATMELDLAATRGVLERSGRLVDALFAADDPAQRSEAAVRDVVRGWQTAKLLANRTAVSTVDRAMTICGGASFSSRHPLSRLYRDARAGGFMQPFGSLDGYPYIGRVALGLDPHAD